MVKPKGFVHRSPTFLVPETSFLEDSFSMDWWWGDGLGMIQAYYAYCTLYYYCVCVCAQSLSCVRLFVTPQTVACQAPHLWDSPGKNTGVGCHCLLQGIFLTRGLNPCLLHLLHWQSYSLPLSHLGNPVCYYHIVICNEILI